MACAADEVASTLRHEALNEIAGLGALVYRLRRRLEAGPPLAVDLVSLLDSIETRLSNAPGRLATRFLPGPRPGQRADMLQAVRQLVAGCRSGAGGPLPVEITSALAAAERPTAEVDADELQVAVGCLLENSLESHTRAGVDASVLLTLRGDRDRLMLEVSDQGPALDPAIVERLLDPFFTTQPGQAGLGLKIARRIAHRWSGDLLIAPSARGGLKVELVFAAAAPA